MSTRNRPLALVLVVVVVFPSLLAQGTSVGSLVSSISSDNQQLAAIASAPSLTTLSASTVSLLQNRNALVEALILAGPAQVRGVMLDPAVAAKLIAADPSAAALIETAGPRTGRLHMRWAENLKQGYSQIQYTLQTGSGTIRLSPTQPLPFARLVNRQVAVSGVGTTWFLAAESVQLAPPATVPQQSRTDSVECSTKGIQNTAVIVLKMPGLSYPTTDTGDPTSPAYWETRFFDTTARSLTTIWQEMSSNQTLAGGKVYGPYTLSQTYSCDQNDEIAAAGFAAASNDLDLTNVTRLAFVFPASSCGWVGLGTLGCNEPDQFVTHPHSTLWVSISPTTDFGDDLDFTISHEMGHNLTLGHANTYDYDQQALGTLDTANTGVVNTEYGDNYSTMGFHGGFYASPHRALYLDWLRPGSDYHEVQSSGTYTIVPTPEYSGVRALRIQRSAVPGSWVWVEYRQNIGIIDPLIPKTAPGSTIFDGALIHYDDPYLIDSVLNGMVASSPTNNTSNLLTMNPVSTPNSFLTATLLPGSSWSDPYSLLTLKTESADANGLVLTASYDTACATLTPSFTGTLGEEAESESITVVAAAGCAWAASTATPWIEFTGATSGSGNGTVNFTVEENGGAQRAGYVTIERQSIAVPQRGTGVSVLGVSPVPGSGLSQSFTLDLAAPDADTLATLDGFELAFMPYVGLSGQGGATFCHIRAEVNQDETISLQVFDDATARAFPENPITVPGPAATAANSHCTVSTEGASVNLTEDKAELKIMLPVTFSQEFPGSYTAVATLAVDNGGQSSLELPVVLGNWTVPGVPAITSVSPPEVRAGYAGPISITGAFTHFSNASTIVGSSLALTSVSAPNVVTLSGTLDVAANATPGATQFLINTGSESVAGSIDIIAGSTTTNLISSVNPQVQNQSVAFTAEVIPTTPPGTPAPDSPPTGTVTFSADGTPLGGAQPLNSNGIATFTTSTLSVGTHSITAVYSGDSNFAQSTSSPLIQTIVSSLPETIELVGGNNQSSVYGTGFAQALSVVVMRAGGIPAAGVTVTFTGAGLNFSSGSVTTNSSGIASVMATGSHVGGFVATAAATGSTQTVSFALTVTPAPLTVTANNATRAFGAANPPFTGTITGVVLGDTFTFAASTVATINSPPGAYPIVPSVTGAALPNYTVTYVNGTLTITKAISSVTLTASPTSAAQGSPVMLTASVPAGATGAVAFNDGINALGTTTIINGTATMAISTLAPGSHSITAIYNGDSNFTPATSTSITVTVLAADFTITSSAQMQIIPPGASASFTIQIPSVTAPFTNLVTLTATGFPAGASYTFDPATVTPGVNGATSTLTISVPQQSMMLDRSDHTPLVLATLLVPFAMLCKSRNRSYRLLLSMLVALASFAAMAGCGSGGYFNQPQQTYTITVTGTSGSLVRSTNVTLTVQ